MADWAERRNQPASWYLMPISFAAILGGTITVIGTSTNLVVSGLLEAAGDAPVGMFELTPVGLPLALIGVAGLVLLAPVLLPDRRGVRRQLDAELRVWVVDPLDGTKEFLKRTGEFTGAAQCVVEAAGGAIFTLDGEPLRYGKPGMRNPAIVTIGDRSLPWSSYIS